MDDGVVREQEVPPGRLVGMSFSILNGADILKFSVLEVGAINDVTNPKLGVPNLLGKCTTCSSGDIKSCDGHYGAIKFPIGVIHPYFISEIVRMLNIICPGCKSVKQNFEFEGSTFISGTSTQGNNHQSCKYCSDNLPWYPRMKFRAASKDINGKNVSEIIVEVHEKLPKKLENVNLSDLLPADYWDFIWSDPQQVELCSSPTTRTLSAAQVFLLLRGTDLKFIKKFVSRPNSLFLTSFPITPNSSRVTESIAGFSNGQKLVFDERTKVYKKLLDHKTPTNEFSLHVRDCFNISKLHSVKPANSDSRSGLKWIKEVLLGKRTDYAFRMTLVGDPRLKLCEIGVPHGIAERLLISESLNTWNWGKLNAWCNLCLFERRMVNVRRNGSLISIYRANELELGDIVYRHLDEGDIVLINRPPSVHQHSIIALSVKMLPVNSVVSLNPVCCSPFRADFDGDCLHGFVSQSVISRVELKELVSLENQLTNQQNGRNLLSLCHDSLTAIYLLREKGVSLNKIKMQQLLMLCPHQLSCPAILKGPECQTPMWTGIQLLSMLLPKCFDFVSPSNEIYINKGEILSSSLGSSWLQDTDDNIFCSLIDKYGNKALDILFAAQEVLLGWMSMRGLTVSLSDLYFCSSSSSRRMMVEEKHYALEEAEQICIIKQLMVDPKMGYLLSHGEEYLIAKVDEIRENHWNKKASLSKLSVSAFKEVFRDLLHRITSYGGKDNSLIAMVKSGSKGSMLKLAQQMLCLGLQHSSVPLPFRVPEKSSSLNNIKFSGLLKNSCDIIHSAGSNFPYAIVEDSFLDGLNPIECFIHSLSCRDTSFSDNADVPGSLTRKLMFCMRDLYMAYDGTVRNAYGNQLVQFVYGVGDGNVVEDSGLCGFGAPVGSLAACSISEATYSALDQPVSILETSPLLCLKSIFEFGPKRSVASRTLSLFLSKNNERWLYGPECVAITLKNNLERVLFSDIVSIVMIKFSLQTCDMELLSPWVCHFHISKEIMQMKGLTVQSIVDALNCICYSEEISKANLPKLQILSRDCEIEDAENCGGTFCITVSVNTSSGSTVIMETVRDLVVPFLLRTVIRGFLEFEKVDILWNDQPITSNSRESSRGELYLKVYISGSCDVRKCWNLLLNECLHIMHLIDWKRSHPDELCDVFSIYGIDVAWAYFMRRLKHAMLDIGKSILPVHLLLVADCLSVTGEFVGLNSRGIRIQRDLVSVSSPFMQACFSSPGPCFIKAAKNEVVDDLLGVVDAVAWGRQIPMGTGSQFDLIYSVKGQEVATPVDVFGMLGNSSMSQAKNVKVKVASACNDVSSKWEALSFLQDSKSKKQINLNCKSGLDMEGSDIWHNVVNMSYSLREILHKYSIGEFLNENDKSILTSALQFHPEGSDKFGSGLHNIKVATHPKWRKTRCFMLVRTDGTIMDFSYQKCVMGAAKAYKLSPKLIDKLYMAFRRDSSTCTEQAMEPKIREGVDNNSNPVCL
ncbi:hypothetical protein Syun_018976 [Stephania yunnanensis]|uniref:DNA-directed RNA polymerase n=1 Tax=Stephania yunnanensis TaxID=152371 RepID=A0AAP0NWV9_9MAGN